MHIEADLDEIHSQRLMQLRQRLQKPLPEVLETVIDWAFIRQHADNGAVFTDEEINNEAERMTALAYLNTVSIDWGGKPIANRDAFYNECSHVLRRKCQYAPEDVIRELSALIKAVTTADVGIQEIRQAWRIAVRYGFGHYDSLIISAALSSNCSRLISEDLQHGQVINDRLTIINPFIQ
ncbi:MAG: PIN domain-containing protein [Methylomonas sp.]